MEAFSGAKVPGMMVFHIPLQEYYNAWVNREGLNFTGEKREVICASEINSGMFSAMVARGDIKAVATGHDHRNDFMVEYGGIKLCYCSTISDTGYCDEDMLGARVFVVSEDNPSNVKTYMSYVDEVKMKENAEPLEEGVILDFDSYAPEFDKSSLWNNVSDAALVDNIVAEIVDGKGLNGTKALHVTRNNFATGTARVPNNVEVRMPLEKPGLLGEGKYFRVWMDLTALTAESYLTHVYFYFSFNSAEMKGNPIYLDNISIVKDYTVFE